MRVALYARVSTTRQAQAQTIDQQLERLRAYVNEQGWLLSDRHSYRDDGYSGASLNRPGLDQLRDQIRLAAFDAVVITAFRGGSQAGLLMGKQLAGLSAEVVGVPIAHPAARVRDYVVATIARAARPAGHTPA